MTNYKFLSKSSSKSNSNLKKAGNSSTAFSAQNQKKFNDFNNNDTTGADLNNNSKTSAEFIEVKIVYPNGKSHKQKISTKKPIYDLLIELSAAARLIPSNYALKLYNDVDDNKDHDLDKVIEYTPNQKIGQLNPVKIKIIPKTATLKHQQFQLFSNSENQKKPDLLPVDPSTIKSSTLQLPENKATNKFTKATSLGSNWIITKSSDSSKAVNSQSNQPTPFELTVCVQVNLPFNQKTIVRCKREILLEDLFRLICREANLEKEKYEFYIPNIQVAYTMQDSFASFDTKEVGLILKKHLKDSVSSSRTLDNRYQSQLVYTQKNSKYTRQATKNQANKLAKEVKQRSKSEIDLSFQTSEEDSFEKINNNSSFNSNESLKNMKRFFSKATGKSDKAQLSKSRGSLNTSECSDRNDISLRHSSLNDSKLSLSSSKSGENRSQSKKRLAPAPPPQGLPNQESLHHAVLQSMMTKKKGKAPAPPPPKPQQQEEPKESMPQPTENVLNIETKSTTAPATIETINITNPSSSISSPSGASSSLSSPLSSLSSQSTHDTTKQEAIDRCLANSLIIPVPEAKSKMAVMNVQAASSPLPNRNQYNTQENKEQLEVDQISEQMSGILKRNDSIRSIGSDIDVSLNNMENSIMSVGSYNRTDDLETTRARIHNQGLDSESECGKITQTSYVKINSIQKGEYTKEDRSFYHSSKELNCVKSGNGAAIDYKSYSEDDYSDMETVQSPAITKNTRSKTSIADSIAESITSSLYNHDLMGKPQNQSHTIFSSIQSLNDSDHTIVVHSKSRESVANNKQNIIMESEDEPKKMISISEVMPQFEKSTVIQIPPETSKNIQVYEDQELSELNSPRYNNEKKSTSSTLPAGTKFTLNLRSPTSPPPQFPAIAENDMNEKHQNFTVVRSGEIIEKNGTYYSTDGTVRGYSGTVRKIANSKTLAEIFDKHKELEQQHERDYEIEVQEKLQKQLAIDKAKQTQTKVNKVTLNSISPRPYVSNPTTVESNTNFRNTLGNIIATEKRSSLPTGIKPSNPNLYSPRPFVKQQQPQTHQITTSTSIVTDELSKKLENRRQSILAAQKKQEEKLQQRALQKALHKQAAAETLHANSNHEMTNLQIDIKSSNSLSSDSNSNLIMSSSSSASSKANISPAGFQVQPPPAPPIDYLLSGKPMSDSSSSSSLSTCSSETPAPTTLRPVKKTRPLPQESPSQICLLLNELKSVVPVVNEGSESYPGKRNSINSTKYTRPTNRLVTKTLDRFKVGPSTAPKNFTTQTLKTINQKNAVVDNRDNLLESIKSFSFNSLRRASTLSEPL